MSYPLTLLNPGMTAADLAADNPTLAQFQLAYEKDTGKMKLGPGAWNDLPYLNPSDAPATDDIPVKASGAEVNTGSNDTKFVTPKAVADSNIAFLSDITDAINNLIGGAPGALDTLNELAAALADDADFSTTVTNALAALRGGPALVAADQTARLALTGLGINAVVRQTDNGFDYQLKVAGGESTAGNWQAVPKVYLASLTQTGTDNPVAVVMGGNTLGAVAFVRDDEGTTFITSAALFTENKTLATFIGNRAVLSWLWTDASNLVFTVGLDVWAGCLKIEVYP